MSTPISGLLFISATNAAFNLTKGGSHEGGIKASFANDRLELTASAFHIRQDDILTRAPNNSAVVLRGGSQVSKGIEMSLNWAATDELKVAFSGTILDAKFDQLIEAGGVNRTGNRPPNVPERLADLVVSYSP